MTESAAGVCLVKICPVFSLALKISLLCTTWRWLSKEYTIDINITGWKGVLHIVVHMVSKDVLTQSFCAIWLQPDSEQAGSTVVQAINAFSTSLYQVLSSQPGNLAVSPFSIGTVLAMACAGAGGHTAHQIAAGLHLPYSHSQHSQAEAGFRALISSLQSAENVTLDIANKMYIKRGIKIKDAFRQSAVDNFRSDAQEVGFDNNNEATRITINQWVEEKTHNKIKNMIDQGTLDRGNLLVLLNAIYFKGLGNNAFDGKLTTSDPFYLTSESRSNVLTLHSTDYFTLGEPRDLKLKALKMPYQGGRYSMLILLPNERDGLGRLEAGIATLNLTHIMDNLWTSKVDVSLPRFKVESSLQLNDALTQLGLAGILQAGANFSGITDENIYVNKVLQKAFVEVTEEGSEDATLIWLNAVVISAPPPNRQFKADHPFLFLILDDTTGAILFMGRVAQPSN